MAKVGLLMTIAGIVGGVLTFMGILQLSGLFSEIHTWVVIAVVGVILFFMTRRPSD